MTSLQDSYITHFKKTSWWRTVSVVGKLLLLILLISYISSKVFYSDSTWQFRQLVMQLKFGGWNWFCVPVILLVPMNWLLESVKWKMLLRPLTSITLSAALKGVLTGLALGFMTPHSLGDYLGRIGQLNHPNRLQALGAILLGRGAQFLSTLLFGIGGLWVWSRVDSSGLGLWAFGITSLILGVLVLLFLLARGYFVIICGKFWPAAVHFIKVLSRYSSREVLVIFGLSSLRYLVFGTQFFLLLYWLDVSLPAVTLMAGVSWVLLAKSVIPAFNFLSDLGVREFSALYFFSFYPVSTAAVLSASLGIWLLNILAPTLVGALFIMQIRIFRN